MKKQYLDYAGLKRVLKRLLPGARKIWHGTLTEWEALSETERDKYDQAEVLDDAGGGITVKRHIAPNYSSSTAEYVTLEETSKKRIILNAYYDFDANVVVAAYFVKNNQLRWKIVSGGVNEGHNVVIEYGEISN